MRNTKIALSLALLANAGCGTFFDQRDCTPQNIHDSWVAEGSPRTIALTLRNSEGAITQETLESAISPYDSSQNPDGNEYSLRVLDQFGNTIFYHEFSFRNNAGNEDSSKNSDKPKIWDFSQAKIYIPARVDMKEAQVYDSNCRQVFSTDIEAAALEDSY